MVVLPPPTSSSLLVSTVHQSSHQPEDRTYQGALDEEFKGLDVLASHPSVGNAQDSDLSRVLASPARQNLPLGHNFTTSSISSTSSDLEVCKPNEATHNNNDMSLTSVAELENEDTILEPANRNASGSNHVLGKNVDAASSVRVADPSGVTPIRDSTGNNLDIPGFTQSASTKLPESAASTETGTTPTPPNMPTVSTFGSKRNIRHSDDYEEHEVSLQPVATNSKEHELLVQQEQMELLQFEQQQQREYLLWQKHQRQKREQKLLKQQQLSRQQRYQPQSQPGDYASLLCLETSVRLGTIDPGGCKRVCFHFIALREGLLELGNIFLHDQDRDCFYRLHKIPTVFAAPS